MRFFCRSAPRSSESDQPTLSAFLSASAEGLRSPLTVAQILSLSPVDSESLNSNPLVVHGARVNVDSAVDAFLSLNFLNVERAQHFKEHHLGLLRSNRVDIRSADTLDAGFLSSLLASFSLSSSRECRFFLAIDLTAFEIPIPKDGYCAFQAVTSILRHARAVAQSPGVDLQAYNLGLVSNILPFVDLLESVSQDPIFNSAGLDAVLENLSGVIASARLRAQDRASLLPIVSANWFDLGTTVSLGLLRYTAPIFIWVPDARTRLYEIFACNRVPAGEPGSAEPVLAYLREILFPAAGVVHSYHLVLRGTDHFSLLRTDFHTYVQQSVTKTIIELLRSLSVPASPAAASAGGTAESSI